VTGATRPRIVIAPHARDLDTALGTLHVSLVYDQFFSLLVAAGGLPLTAWAGSPDVDNLLDVADGVLLIGGGDVAPERFGLAAEADALDPRRDEFESRLVLGSKARGTPVLGVCRGAQMLNVAVGGTLRRVEGHRQAIPLDQATHDVEVADGTRLAGIAGTDTLAVNSFHSWAPGELGEGLRASATASDGVVEGFESDDAWWALGIQWHLELLDDPATHRVFDALVAEARAR
jgi:gamma-glutamyl-gamma-aminobutyrate hydrolase PuuD